MRGLNALLAAVTILISLPAGAHRLDEYLQASLLSVDQEEIHGTIRLVPGVAVASEVISRIDTDGDGVFSTAEQHAYALHVLEDVRLELDDKRLTVQLVSFSFPPTADMLDGTGEIELTFSAILPRAGGTHTIRFSNQHLPNISVYLVNTLVPSDATIQLGEQVRDINQSHYQITYTSGNGLTQEPQRNVSGFAGAFRLGLRHIAEGTDHLLFLLTLLLPAPLLARRQRWNGQASVKQSLVQIIRIVTAFTIGHSLTLLLSAFNVLALPSHPVEILIAVSIFVSAIHAMRPIFPGRESLIAAFFGLIHGAAFASALSHLGFDRWYKMISVLAFNLGIETMQLIVVLAILPSLLLLSRTVAYPWFRWAGAMFAAVASLGWVVERVLERPNEIGFLVEDVAREAPWLALALFAVSVGCWSTRALRLLPQSPSSVNVVSGLDKATARVRQQA